MEMKFKVTADQALGRKKDAQEDRMEVTYGFYNDKNGDELTYAFFGIFDGHGGKQAADYAKANLRQEIMQQEGFWGDDDEIVKQAMKYAFKSCHLKMMASRDDTWPKRRILKDISTAGTTVTVIFLRGQKLYIAHVGDSTAVLGVEDEEEPGFWKGIQLTKDHKASDKAENENVRRAGGAVAAHPKPSDKSAKMPRVAIKVVAPISVVKGTGYEAYVTKTLGDRVLCVLPFLAVTRSLGDFWSWEESTKEFAVSPIPDVNIIDLDELRPTCLILASDGLWDRLNPQEAVDFVCGIEKGVELFRPSVYMEFVLDDKGCLQFKNAATCLIDYVLRLTEIFNTPQDNTSAICITFDTSTFGGTSQDSAVAGPSSALVSNAPKFLKTEAPKEPAAAGPSAAPRTNFLGILTEATEQRSYSAPQANFGTFCKTEAPEDSSAAAGCSSVPNPKFFDKTNAVSVEKRVRFANFDTGASEAAAGCSKVSNQIFGKTEALFAPPEQKRAAGRYSALKFELDVTSYFGIHEFSMEPLDHFVTFCEDRFSLMAKLSEKTPRHLLQKPKPKRKKVVKIEPVTKQDLLSFKLFGEEDLDLTSDEDWKKRLEKSYEKFKEFVNCPPADFERRFSICGDGRISTG